MNSVDNVIVQGIMKDIHMAWKSESLRATLILVYCGIDAFARLCMDPGKEKATRADFVGWVEKFLRFRDANRQYSISLPGLELYAARCALIHSYGSEADLHVEGKVQRQIGYTNEMLPEVVESSDTPGLVMVSIRGLVDGFSEAAMMSLREFGKDEAGRALLAARLDKMGHELPLET